MNQHRNKWNNYQLTKILVGITMFWSVFHFSGYVAYAPLKQQQTTTAAKLIVPSHLIPSLSYKKALTLVYKSNLYLNTAQMGIKNKLLFHNTYIKTHFGKLLGQFLSYRQQISAYAQQLKTLLANSEEAAPSLSILYLG